MKAITKLIILVFLSIEVVAQNDISENSKYNYTISLIKIPNNISGEIYSMDDSSIIIRHKIKGKRSSMATPIFVSVPVVEIDKITIKKNASFFNKVAMYSIIGTAICLVDASGHDLDASFASSNSQQFSELSVDTETLQAPAILNADIPAYGTGIFGTLIDVLSGNNEFIIPINGKIENFVKWKGMIACYSINK